MCWWLLILAVCVFVAVSSFVLFLDGTMVNFGDCSSILLALFASGNEVNGVSSSWKIEVSL
jgi:hypothetical protein